MATEEIKVTITGESPLLMHAFPLAGTENIEKKSREEQAELAAYRIDGKDSNLYLSGVALQRALVAGATFSKGKGRATLQKQVAACVLITPDKIDLGIKTYAIDERPVVVPATRGRVVRFRPRLEKWQAHFSVEFDPDLITETQLRAVFDDTGKRVGVLDFRPERKGPFGRFVITSWV